ncbi:MAG: J domain-containing protein [Treponema sp.]|jgi:tetratricopeptide (TPR) repeat protein|nr:J domain-containing protein [Treponema sp.]
MINHYSTLAVRENASTQEIKRAFRDKAKRLHPDIAGKEAEAEMRKLLAAYEVLSDRDRRYEYDRAYSRFIKKVDFDYRSWLRDHADDPASRAKLVFFELFHLEEDAAIAVWDRSGALDFPMERYLDREDWMDCVYLLAEKLDERGRYYEAFELLTILVREERRRPYFRHFMDDVEGLLKELVRLRLRAGVGDELWIDCMETLLELGFSPRDEARWLRSMAETLLKMGDEAAARSIVREALRRDPGLPNAGRLREKLNV